MSDLLRFGPFELDPDAEELKRGGLVLRIPHQPLRVLLLLVRNAGETVTREQIQAEIWGDGTYVDFEHGINAAVRQIRFHLNDNAESPRYVRTVARKGYGFIARVERVARPAAAPPDAPATAARRSRFGWRSAAAALIAAFITSAVPRATIGEAHRRTIAVMPFRAVGPAPPGVDTSAFAEELRATLGALPQQYVRMVDWRSGAATVAIDGTVQQVPGGARVIVTASDPRKKTQLWSATYQRPPERGAAMPIDVAHHVLWEVVDRYLPPPRRNPRLLTRVSSAALEAYNAARAVQTRSLRDRDWNRTAELFQRAIREEPRFAEAWSGLADLWGQRALSGPQEQCDHAARMARWHAARALALQPHNAEARSLLSVLDLQYDYDFAGAEDELRRAIADDPQFATLHFNLAVTLATRGQFGAALREYDVARSLDPIMFDLHPTSSLLYFYARHYDDALAGFREIQAVNPQWPIADFGVLWVYVAEGKWAEATAAARSIAHDPPADAAAATADDFRAAYRRLEPVMLRAHAKEIFNDYHLALYYGQLGDRDRALAFLQSAIEKHAPAVCYVLVDPRIDPLRNDPRFDAILARSNVGKPRRETLLTAITSEPADRR
jgi:DNA-binding winged helix-turn-helix (wHTH) protein/tetratricopeptide (TPR) repeat protein